MSMVFISGRQLGKTEQICRWWLVDPENRIIISSSQATADITRRRLRTLVHDKWAPGQMTLIDRNVMAWSPHLHLQGQPRRIAVDDVENILGHMFGQVPDFITMTGQMFGERDADG